MSRNGAGPPEDATNDRWSRRLNAGDALSSTEALQLSDVEAARLEERAELARQGANAEPFSVLREESEAEPPAPLEQLTVNEFAIDRAVDTDQIDTDPIDTDPIDLTEPDEIDLRTPSVESRADSFTELELEPSTRIASSVPPPPAPSSEGHATPDPYTDSLNRRSWNVRPPEPPESRIGFAETSETTDWPAWPDVATDDDEVSATDTAATDVDLDHNQNHDHDHDEAVAATSDTATHTVVGDADDSESHSSPLTVPTDEHEVSKVSIAPEVVEAPGNQRTGDQPGRRSGLMLLLIAAVLAVLTGVLGTMLLLERSNTSDLRDEIERANAAEGVSAAGLEQVNNDVRTLELENDRLQQQLNDMSALVLELPEGRVTPIAVPFTPLFADEENGRLIAIGEGGEYITWGEGVDGPITDTGQISGTPTGLFAATRKAWVSTEAGLIEVLSLVAGEPGLPPVEFGPIEFLAAEERGYWTYNQNAGEVVRLRKSDGGITASASIPVPVIDLTIGAGSVWALGDDGLVYRINTADLTVTPIEDAGEDLISVTAGPDALWTLSAADGSLRRIDPVSGDVLVTVPVGRDPIDATFAGRSVWVPLRSGSSLIEVDTRTSAVVSRTPLEGEPIAIHTGESGVFVTTTDETNPLIRVSPLEEFEREAAEQADESS